MIDESSIDVYRRSKHLTMSEARTLIKRGCLEGDSAGSNSALRAGGGADGGIDVARWYLRKMVVGMNNLPVFGCLDSEWWMYC